MGHWRTGLDNKTGAHTHLMNRLLKLGFDPSEIEVPTFSEWPKECSPMPAGYYSVHDDSFFVDWISEGLRVSPGKIAMRLLGDLDPQLNPFLGFAGSSPLQEAILVDSSEVVERILRNSQVQEDVNILGQSSLHLAVWRPRHLKTLLQAGFDVNSRDWNGRTPLMYAAAAGMRKVAVSLVKAGADIWAQDNLYSKHTWLEYGTLSNHWDLVLDVIYYVRKLGRFSKEDAQKLLDAAIISWADKNAKAKNSSHFATLLKWGANPEVRWTAKWPTYEADSTTLLHRIENCTDFDVLLNAGFTSSNHVNSRGLHPLMTQLDAGNPELIQKTINAGGGVDHQDHIGSTALHICSEIIRSGILSIVPHDADLRFQTLKNTEVLLSNGANPFLTDHCRCPCSTSGCTPAGILLKDLQQKIGNNIHRSYPLTMHSWVNRWLRLLHKFENDSEYSRHFFLDTIRLSKFEQLELTHTCCRFTNPENRVWIIPEDEDVQEIRDEEQELSDILESEMSDIQLYSISELENIWRHEMDKLMMLQGSNFLGVGNPVALCSVSTTAPG